MCQVLEVSQSGFYDWQKREASKRYHEKQRLMNKISHYFHESHNKMAGSPTIVKDLHDDPEFQTVHRSRVAAIMKEMGLKCKIQKQFVATTDSDHDEPIAENLLNRNFNPDEPHRYIVSDITYIRVASHWVYLSVFIDLFSRKVVGWDLSESLAADSTCNALKKYLFKYGYQPGLMIHSDRGIQYACKQFRDLLSHINSIQSMSRKGNCWDNAVAESFFHTLKTRLIYHRKYETMEDLQRDLYWYIEIYYNRKRKHSHNNWMTPEDKESNFYSTQQKIADVA
jgi:putative transposase